MTTISLNRRQKGPPLRTILLVVALLFVVGILSLWRGPLTNLLWRLLEPVMSWRATLDTSEVSKLRAALASTTALVSDRNALFEENRQLKSLMGRSPSTHSIVASVIMRPPGIPYDTLMVDAGAEDGVIQGEVVYGGGTLQIGIVKEVYDRSARVVLFSSPGNEYQALLRGAVPLALVGQGAGSLSAEVPGAVAVAVGDSVTSAGIAGGFVGRVSFISAPAGVSFKTIYVQLPVNVFELRFVEIR